MPHLRACLRRNASISTRLLRTELYWRLFHPRKVVTQVGGQDEKEQFRVGRREGEREGRTDGSSS